MITILTLIELSKFSVNFFLCGFAPNFLFLMNAYLFILVIFRLLFRSGDYDLHFRQKLSKRTSCFFDGQAFAIQDGHRVFLWYVSHI